MCELFAMSSLYPAAVSISLSRLAEHGGLTGPHRDGWGVAYQEGRDARLFKGTEPASDSPWVPFIRDRAIESPLVISHIRRATLGGKSYSNCQPFIRELGGRMHLFVHNGHLPGIAADPEFSIGIHRPVGETDSEYAFCSLLARLRPHWLEGAGAPPLKARFELLRQFAAELRPLGPANFLYSDGEYLFAHGDRRHQPDGSIAAPGLHFLERHCRAPNRFRSPGVSLDIGRHDGGEQRVVLFASVPLSDEQWRPLEEGALLVAGHGTIVNPETVNTEKEPDRRRNRD